MMSFGGSEGAYSVREREAALIASLAEFDARRLYLAAGCSSLFTYCTQVLHLSEHAAYGRIEAARAARRFPVLLDLLADGALTLTAVCLVATHLTAENNRELLAAARHKTKRELELLVATLRPQPVVPATVRKLPASKSLTTTDGSVLPCDQKPNLPPLPMPPTSEPPKRSAVVAPLTPELYKLQVTLSTESHAMLRRAQDLLRHAFPTGDLSVIIDRALKVLVRQLEQQKFAATNRPRTVLTVAQGRSRHIPADVRRRVWQRDGGQCAFVGIHGRCTERGFLEFHHVQPYGDGGESVVENLELRCRPHNVYEAERWEGTLFAREASHVYSVQDRGRENSSSSRFEPQSSHVPAIADFQLEDGGIPRCGRAGKINRSSTARSERRLGQVEPEDVRSGWKIVELEHPSMIGSDGGLGRGGIESGEFRGNRFDVDAGDWTAFCVQDDARDLGEGGNRKVRDIARARLTELELLYRRPRAVSRRRQQRDGDVAGRQPREVEPTVRVRHEIARPR